MATLGKLRQLPRSYRGPGLRVRFSRFAATKKGVLENPLYLPVVLGDFTVDEEFLWEDYDTVAAGEFSLPAAGPDDARRLRTPDDLETLTIDWHRYARWLSNPLISPEKAQSELLKLGRSRSPFLITATLPQDEGSPTELRMHASLRGIRRSLRPGEADTRYYSLSIREWRDWSVTRRQAGHGGGGRKDKLPTTHKLLATTTLVGLAKVYYPGLDIKTGVSVIAKANGIVIPSAGGVASPGTLVWGSHTPLAESKKFKIGDRVKIPTRPSGPEQRAELVVVRIPAYSRTQPGTGGASAP